MTGSRSRARNGGAELWPRLRAPLLLAGSIALLVSINFYVLYYRHGTSVPALLDLANAGRRAGLSARLSGPAGTPPVPARLSRKPRGPSSLPDYPRLVEVQFRDGDTLASVLERSGLGGRMTAELQATLTSLLDPGGVGAGQSLTFFFDSDDRLAALDYRLTPTSAYHLERVATGSTERFIKSRQDQPLAVEIRTITLPLSGEGGLLGAVTRAGEHPALAARLSEILACEAGSLAAVLGPGRVPDRFKVVVERVTLGGAFYRYGRLLALEHQKPDGKALRAYLGPGGHKLANAGAGSGAASAYYTELGESLGRAVCPLPLAASRAGEPTHYRVTPHEVRGKPALDFEVAPGTPVVAAGPGRVLSVVSRPGAPASVVIQHAGGVETSYQQLGRLARGIAEGQTVRLRQVLGYVGSGGSTPAVRPHLHYALRVGSKLVDPLRYRSPREAPLAADRRTAWRSTVVTLSDQLSEGEQNPLTAQAP